MEKFHDMLLSRHSIRRYTAEPLNPDDVKTILEAALLSPSSKSARPWQFVVVEDKSTMERLSACKRAGSVSLKNAVLAVVICASPEKSDMFIEDCAVAANMMHLQAAALGIGSCWVQVRDRYDAEGEDAQNIVRNILGIPYDMVVECIMTFGYSAETRRPVDPEKLLWEKIHLGSWRIEDSEQAEQ